MSQLQRSVLRSLLSPEWSPPRSEKEAYEDHLLQRQEWLLEDALADGPGNRRTRQEALRQLKDAERIDVDGPRIRFRDGYFEKSRGIPAYRRRWTAFGKQGAAAWRSSAQGRIAIRCSDFEFKLDGARTGLNVSQRALTYLSGKRLACAESGEQDLGTYRLGRKSWEALMKDLNDTQRAVLLQFAMAHHQYLARSEWRRARIVELDEERSLTEWVIENHVVGSVGCRNVWSHCAACFHGNMLRTATKYLKHGSVAQQATIRLVEPSSSAVLRQAVKDALNFLAAHDQGPTHALIVPSVRSLTHGCKTSLHAHILMGGRRTTCAALNDAFRRFGLHTSGIEAVGVTTRDQARCLNYALAQTYTDGPDLHNKPRHEVWTPARSRMRRLKNTPERKCTEVLG